jgi:hypothetical protein
MPQVKPLSALRQRRQSFGVASFQRRISPLLSERM